MYKRHFPIRQGHGGILTYQESVAHQFVSSLTNLGTVASGREELLRTWRGARKEALERGRRGPAVAYYFAPGDHPARAARLADRLAALGIEVERLTAAGSPLQARHGCIGSTPTVWSR